MATRQDPRVPTKPQERIAHEKEAEQQPKAKAKPVETVFTDWAMI